ncbi:MAG: hypothetical protein ACLFRY_03485 [Spirochaetia bacterium]
MVIYHLYRNDGTSLFLHPFDEKEKSIDIFEKKEIVGKYGREPRVEALTAFRNELYRIVENRVNAWIGESRFIPKFLISAGVFLASYLFMALVIRDPLPMIDEIAIGLGISILTFFLIGRKDRRSDVSLKKRIQLRTKVDRIIFQENDFVREIEDALWKMEKEDADHLVEEMLDPIKGSLSNEEREDAKRIAGYLKGRFRPADLRRKEKILKKFDRERKKGNQVKAPGILSAGGKVDLSLFAVYTRVKQSYEKVDS